MHRFGCSGSSPMIGLPEEWIARGRSPATMQRLRGRLRKARGTGTELGGLAQKEGLGLSTLKKQDAVS